MFDHSEYATIYVDAIRAEAIAELEHDESLDLTALESADTVEELAAALEALDSDIAVDADGPYSLDEVLDRIVDDAQAHTEGKLTLGKYAKAEIEAARRGSRITVSISRLDDCPRCGRAVWVEGGEYPTQCNGCGRLFGGATLSVDVDTEDDLETLATGITEMCEVEAKQDADRVEAFTTDLTSEIVGEFEDVIAGEVDLANSAAVQRAITAIESFISTWSERDTPEAMPAAGDYAQVISEVDTALEEVLDDEATVDRLDELRQALEA